MKKKRHMQAAQNAKEIPFYSRDFLLSSILGIQNSSALVTRFTIFWRIVTDDIDAKR